MQEYGILIFFGLFLIFTFVIVFRSLKKSFATMKQMFEEPYLEDIPPETDQANPPLDQQTQSGDENPNKA